MAECNVCVERYNKSTRKCIKCVHCNFEACFACVGKVLVESSNDPACMSCNKSWNIDFLSANFTKTFLNVTLKKHREDQLFERETGLLPMTQPAVERELQRRTIVKDRVDLLARKKELEALLREVNEKIRRQGRDLMRLDNPQAESSDATKEKRQFVRRCPANDCMGFLSTAWKCGLCSNWACPTCHEVIGLDKNVQHVCKPENVETAKLLAKDTKPCPKCTVPIFKIMGCSQMYCTCCHTAWNWNTGKIETGAIHNPHYFELQRKLGYNPRRAGDVPCGGIPDAGYVGRKISKHGFKMDDVCGVDLALFIRWIIHQHEIVRPRFIVDNVHDNIDLRIKLMLKEIDEVKFKRYLQMREKARNKKREIEQIISTLYTISTDIVRNMIEVNETRVINTAMKELEEAVKYSVEGLSKVQQKFGGVVPDLAFRFDGTMPKYF